MDRELSDLSGALGRSAWMVGLIILGYGFAGLIAIGLTTRRAYQWRQPFALMSALVLCPLALTTPTSWFESFNHIEWLGTTSVIFAAVSVGWLIMSVKRDDGLFVAPALWGAHLLGLTTALFSQQLVMMIGAFLLMSMITWWTGILTLRTSWRVVGAFHLGVSWLFLILYLGQSTTALSGALLFISLLTAIHLFVVTTLTQTHMKKLSES